MFRHNTTVAIILALALPTVLGAPALVPKSEAHSRNDSTWEAFKKARTDMLVRLAVPIEDCWSRNATFLPGYTSPMFHACVDWHSSVHAAYSLYAITEASGNDRYKNLADTVIHGDKIQAEIEYMNTATYNNLTFLDLETPYGMAWMFNLLMQRKQTTADNSLRPLGDLAAATSKAYLKSLSNEEVQKEMLVPAHYNLSWGIIHLARWAKYMKDECLLKSVQRKFLSVALNPSFDQLCPAVKDTTSEYEEFFPPCLMRIAGVIGMWNGTGEELKDWVEERISSDFIVPPVTHIVDSTGHKFAINFSRAYALWYIYRATGNTAFRDNYANLIIYQMSRPDFWDISAGYNPSHFVPQFGVRAIELSRDDEII